MTKRLYTSNKQYSCELFHKLEVLHTKDKIDEINRQFKP